MNAPGLPPPLAFAALICLGGSFSLPAEEEDRASPLEWVIETYSFPADELVKGFAIDGDAPLLAPNLPVESHGETEMLEFLRNSNSVVGRYLEQRGISLPSGTVAAFDPDSLTLAVRAPRFVQWAINDSSDKLQRRAPAFLELNTVLLEGDAAIIRETLALAGESADHSEVLARLEASVPAGQVKVLARDRIEIPRVQYGATSEDPAPYHPGESSLAPDGDNHSNAAFGGVETSWETAAVVDEVSRNLYFDVRMLHRFAPSPERSVPFASSAMGEISSEAVETSAVELATRFDVVYGASKLLGVWRPASIPGGGEAPEKLQAGFLSTDLVDGLPSVNRQLSAIVERYGDSIAELADAPPEVNSEPLENDPDEMVTRLYRVPPTIGYKMRRGTDPFRYDLPHNFGSRTIFRNDSYYVRFPKGAIQRYDPAQGTLLIRNTQKYMSAVERSLKGHEVFSGREVWTTVYFIEGPAMRMLEAVSAIRGTHDHTDAWLALENDETIRHLSTYWLGSTVRKRSELKVAQSFHYPVGNRAAIEKVPEESISNGATDGEFSVAEIGTLIRFEPHLGGTDSRPFSSVFDPDVLDLRYAISFDYAAPTISFDPSVRVGESQFEAPTTAFHRAELAGTVTLRHGTMRLLGFWRPEGDPRFEEEEMLQAVFLKTGSTAVYGATKLLGAWKPASIPGGKDDPDRIQAAFISVDRVEVLPSVNHQLAELIEKHGDVIATIPEGPPAPEPSLETTGSDGVVTRIFFVPWAADVILGRSRSPGVPVVKDPFADPDDGSSFHGSNKGGANTWLEERMGIPKPEGTSYIFNPATSKFIIRSTPEIIDLVEAVLQDLALETLTCVGYTAYFVEGPANRVLEAVSATEGIADHGQVWEKLARDDSIRHLSTLWGVSKGRSLSELSATRTFHVPVGAAVSLDGGAEAPEAGEAPVATTPNPAGALSWELEAIEIGTRMRLSTELDEHGQSLTVRYTLGFDYAEPSTAIDSFEGESGVQPSGPVTRLHRASVEGTATMQDGLVRLLGWWSPEGDPRFEEEELLQAVFLKTNVISPLEARELAD